MAEAIIHIGNKDIPMRATAAVPMLYRRKFGRDIMHDMSRLRRGYLAVIGDNTKTKAKVTEEQQMQLVEQLDTSTVELLAYIMAKHAAPESVSDSLEKWLEQFGTQDILAATDKILMLWADNEQTSSVPKKKLKQ